MKGTPEASAMDYFPPQVPGNWSTGFFDCTEDVGNCVFTAFCPCITFGRIADILERGSPSCGVCCSLYTLFALLSGWAGQCICSWSYRSKFKALYSLPNGGCRDTLLHCFCEPCSLCQMYREFKHRGFDVDIGWHGNVRRQSRGVTQPPFVPGGMTR